MTTPLDLNQFYKQVFECQLIYGSCVVKMEEENGFIRLSFVKPDTCLGPEEIVTCLIVNGSLESEL